MKPAEDVRLFGLVDAGHAAPVRYIRAPRGGRRGYDAMASRLDDLFSEALSEEAPEIAGLTASRRTR